MSYSTTTSRAPSGSAGGAGSGALRSPAVSCSGAVGCAPATSPGSSAGMTRRSRRPVVRRSFKTTLTARRCSQELNALSPRNERTLSHSRTKTSCVRSSASRASPVRRRQSAYTRPACRRYNSRKAVWSPACARATRSSGGGTELRRRRLQQRLERNLRQANPRQIAQPPLELFLQFVQARALLGDLRLRLILDLGHARPHGHHLGVDQGVHTIAHLLLGGGDLLAQHGAEARGDRLIEIRAHGEGRVMQLAREPRLHIEVRNTRHRPPDQVADRRVAERRVARPAHIARPNRKARANRVTIEIETELRGGRAGIESQRHAGNLEYRKANTAHDRSGSIDWNTMQMIEHHACAELWPSR